MLYPHLCIQARPFILTYSVKRKLWETFFLWISKFYIKNFRARYSFLIILISRIQRCHIKACLWVHPCSSCCCSGTRASVWIRRFVDGRCRFNRIFIDHPFIRWKEFPLAASAPPRPPMQFRRRVTSNRSSRPSFRLPVGSAGLVTNAVGSKYLFCI